MRKIDAFAHILPRSYLERLQRQLEKTMERHPRQLVIAHHGGDMVPHFSARLAMGPGYRQVKDRLPRPPLDYFRRFHVDTAGLSREGMAAVYSGNAVRLLGQQAG